MRKNFKDKRASCKVCYPHKRGFVSRWKEKEVYALRQWERERIEWARGAMEHDLYPYPPKSYEEWPEPPDTSDCWVFE